MNAIIKGKVQHPQYTDITKYNKLLSLQLYSCTLTKEQKLKEIPFDKNGDFKVELEEENIGVQYIVKLLYGKGTKKELIKASAKLCPCKTHTLNFYFDPKRYEILLSYLTEQIQAHLEGLSLTDLNEEQMQQLACLSKQDISDLRALQLSTLWHKELVEFAKKTLLAYNKNKSKDKEYFQMASFELENLLQETQACQSFLFALAKEGLTVWKKGLSASTKQLSNKIETANANKWVYIDKRAQNVILKGLGYLRDAILLQANYDNLFYDAKLLYISSLSFTEKSKLLDAALEKGSLTEILNEAKNNSRKKSNKIWSAFKAEYEILSDLDKVLEQFPPLLYKTIQKSSSKNRVDYNKIYTWDTAIWKEQIQSLATEQQVPDKFKKQEQPIEAYALAIQYNLGQNKPALFASAAIGNTKIPNKTSIKKHLVHHPDFMLGKATVSSYFTTNKEEEDKVFISEKEMKNMQTFSRVTQLAGGVENLPIANTLYDLKLTSATHIYRRGKGNLVNDFKKFNHPKEWALQVYCRAQAAYKTAVFLAAQYQAYDKEDALIPSVLQVNSSSPPTISRSANSGLVNMEDLFGSMDYCSCGHCHSVLSPAAYMTDLLHWLKADIVCDNGKTGFEPIQNRRPDIGEIQLSCKNTHELMPYIDLVNEVLLYNLTDFKTATDKVALLKSFQTNWETEQLITEPEHWNNAEFYNDVTATSSSVAIQGAYVKLKQSYVPTALPYDRDWSESRGYLEKFGFNQADLISLFSNNDFPQNHNINWAKAYLGIDDKSYNFLIENSIASDFLSVHLNQQSLPANLGFYLSFLKIDKNEFQSIYETKFVSNETTLLPSDKDFDGCDWNEYEITSTIDKNLLHRFLRFFRLFRLSELTIEQLDNTIYINSETNITDNSLINIATCLQFAGQTQITFNDVLIWFSNQSNSETIFVQNNQMSLQDLIFFNRLFKYTGSTLPQDPLKVAELFSKIKAFASIGIPIQQFEDLFYQEGFYELQNDTAVNPDFDLIAKNGWEFLKSKLIAEPDTSSILKEDFYNTLAFNLELDNEVLSGILENNDASWADNCITNLLDEKIDWTSGNNILFTNKYRFLLRIAKFSKALLLEKDELQLGIDYKLIGNSLNLPVIDCFDWLDINVVIPNYDSLLWLKNALIQKESKEISLLFQFEKATQLSNISSLLTTSNASALINNLYNKVYHNVHEETNITEFRDFFWRSVELVSNQKDLVELQEKLDELRYFSLHHKVNINILKYWVWDSSNTLINIGIKRNEIKTALRSTYADFTSWAKTITPLHNQFRTQLRDALLAYYIAHKGFENSTAIHAHFLLDPEMQACMKTSRIKLAISSIQLLVHRGLMGLGADFCPDENDKRQWEWRKNYRVWEANKKIFLYPENWIEPELRLDKTPFFEELEDTLLQDEINTANSEKALSAYLSKFKEISRLDIRAQYYDEELKELHVFARTWTAPFIYYYRKREIDKKWTAWEKMEVDIDGDHIIPIIFNQRLYLFFPLFIDKQHNSIKRTIDKEERNAAYLEVKMCYTKLEYNTWTAKKILDGTLLAGDYAGPGVFNNLDNKLGKEIPAPTIQKINNPNFDRIKWFGGIFPKPRKGEYPNLYSPHGPYKLKYTSNDIHRGNVVFDNENFKDYTKVSLEKDAFYFWAKTNPETGDLTIHVRRDFHDDLNGWHWGENEIAYEDCFLVNACDERVSIIPAEITEKGYYDKRFLAQPYLTQPHAQQLKKGVNYEEAGGDGIFIKKKRSHRGDFYELVHKTQGNYVLTYPHQNKDALWTDPFFYSDDRHTYFFERAKKNICIAYLSPKIDGGEVTWEANCIKIKALTDKYEVKNHEHPFACMLTAAFNRFGIEGLYDSENNKIKRQQYEQHYFYGDYFPNLQFIAAPYPKLEYDFTRIGSHSDYNWELFFHIPGLIARQLRLNGQFAESINWLRFVFDPTSRETGHGKLRFWKIKPFMKDVSQDSITNLLRLLSAANPSAPDAKKRDEFLLQIEAWENRPFEPHLIASFRFRAYMLWTVMEYVETLTDWGDMLFRQDTIESINEASQLYLMAGELLGKRAKKIQKKSNPITTTFNAISSGLDAFSNIAIELENQITPAISKACNCCSGAGGGDTSLPNLLFCVPHNPKITEMWERVADRLFKVRHCMNIEGQVRELPLFQPPIDPALLVRATAMGLDIGSVLAEVYAPDPHYRFSYLLQKANEFTAEVKSLGGQLLSTLEKKDAEELSQIRQVHEQNILKATRNLKKMAIEEAKLGLESAKHSKKLIEIRLAEYEGREYMNRKEKVSMALNIASEALMIDEKSGMLMAKVLGIIPQTHLGPLNPQIEAGGLTLKQINDAVAASYGIASSILRTGSTLAGTLGSYDRRQEDWNFQIKTAKEELLQVEKSILSAEIRLAIAEKDLENHDLQIKQSQEIYDYVKTKFTNLKLYTWMSNQLMKLHRRAYELAYDMAKQAERAMKKELVVDDSLKHIQFDNWNTGNRGLLAGERLSVQLKELDHIYSKNDKRRFELSKDISLKLLDPTALVKLLLSTGNKESTFNLTKGLFKNEFDDNAYDKVTIKSISLSIPCITGPQISTNVKLKINNEEFITSTGINDSGIFEPGYSQARYMPFEYLELGDSLTCTLSLNKDSEFDITTIADVVLHINYYLEKSNTGTTQVATANTNNSKLLMSWKHDFPLEWQKYKNPNISISPSFQSPLDSKYVPYKYRSKKYNQQDLFYLVLDKDELTVLGSSEFDPNNPGTKKVEDIWLLYG